MCRQRLATSMLLFAIASGALAAPPIDFSGEWWSGRCAHVLLAQSGSRLTGSYDPNKGEGKGTSFELNGFRTGADLIAFTVSLGSEGPIVSWTGQHTVLNQEEVIISKWHMATDVPDELETEDSILGAVWSGADIFKRTKPNFCS